MHRPARSLAVLGATIATVAVVTSCSKPTPEITVLSGSTVTTLKPQTYCFDVEHCRIAKAGNVSSLKAKAGSTLMIAVPHKVANSNWAVTSANLQANGTFQTIVGEGLSSTTQHDSHNTRITVPYGTGDYYLVIREQDGDKSTGSWIARVSIRN